MRTKKHILVSGRVQAVGFRNYTSLLAKKYEVQGWVRNLKDGRVEAFVSGEEEKIDLLIKALRTGPPAASVSRLEIEDSALFQIQQERGFKIEEDGLAPWHAELS